MLLPCIGRYSISVMEVHELSYGHDIFKTEEESSNEGKESLYNPCRKQDMFLSSDFLLGGTHQA